MSNQPKPAIEKYLQELEVAAKQCVGVHPNQILRDAQEHLSRDYDALLLAEPGLTDDAILEHFHQSYGRPCEVAKVYEQFSDSSSSRIPASAPNWRICCGRCGRSAPAARVGITRLGARSTGKRVLGWCKGCHAIRWLKLVRDLNCTGSIKPVEDLQGVATQRKVRSLALFFSPVLLLVLMMLLPFLISALSSMVISKIQAAQAIQSSRAPGLQRTPSGWEFVRETEVGIAQLSQFSKKLGVSLESVFNTVVRFDNKELQINTITTHHAEDALRVKETMRRGKPNPRWVTQNGSRVYEFVVRTANDARLASAARYAYLIEPSERRYQVSFDAIPISKEERGIAPDHRNRLFNLIIQGSAKPANSKEIADLSKGFKFAQEIELVKDLQGQFVSDWSSTNAEVVAANPESCRMRITGSAKRFEMPMVTLKATISVDTRSQRKVDPKLDTAELLAANSRFPTDLPQLKAVVDKLILPKDSDSAKLRKLLNWFADPANLRYDGLVGARYGVSVALNQHFGRCWDFSDLFITMARIAGLPARQVYGWLFESEGHVWCDVIVDGHWQMVDPTTGTIAGSDYIPFSMSTAGEFSILYASPIEIIEN